MKFVILLLTFIIALHTSTGDLFCYQCEGTKDYCITLERMEGYRCKPEEDHCFTLFSAEGKLIKRHCIIPSPEQSIFADTTNYVRKTGCQSLKDKDEKIVKHVCLCDKNECNNQANPSGSERANGRSAGAGNKSKNNSCKIVGMSLTTLLGTVLALLLLK